MAVTVIGALTGTLINEATRSVPGRHYAQVQTRTHAAATATDFIATWTAPHALKVVASYFMPLAAVTGDNTDTTFLNVVYAELAGIGATELSSLELLTGENLTANAKNSLNGVTAYTQVMVAGDVLALAAEKSNSGVLIPEGTWIIAYVNV
jgi:hypothetical protein